MHAFFKLLRVAAGFWLLVARAADVQLVEGDHIRVSPEAREKTKANLRNTTVTSAFSRAPKNPLTCALPL